MTREELVVSGYWRESDWAKPCGVKIVGFYSLSVRAPSDGGDSGLDTHGGVGETVASVPFRSTSVLSYPQVPFVHI